MQARPRIKDVLGRICSIAVIRMQVVYTEIGVTVLIQLRLEYNIMQESGKELITHVKLTV